MASSFGARLRAQRERQQVELTTISEQTKIRLSLLEELERDDLSRWPSGIFRRSYIRSYARAVGLEPDVVVREFLDVYPDTVEDMRQVAAARGVSVESLRQSPPTRLRFLLHSAIDALPALHSQSAHKSSPAPIVVPDAGTHPVEVASPCEPEPPSALPASPSPVSENNEISDDGAPRVDLSALARLCTGLACASSADDVMSLLEDAATILEAVGLTIWTADHQRWLTPIVAHGYPNGLAKMPHVPSDADNAIAAAFRSAATRVVDGSSVATGAVVVPIMTSSGCAGVLALELLHRREQHECVRAAATILAAQLSTLLVSPSLVRAATA
jgi:Helix-turn-helix domain